MDNKLLKHDGDKKPSFFYARGRLPRRSNGIHSPRASLFGKDSHHWQGGQIKRQCLTCNKEFHVDPNVIKRGYGKFCSRSCGSKRTYGHKSAPKKELYCIICDKKFYEYVSNLVREKNRGKCCSKECRIEYTKNKIKKFCKNCGKEFSVHPSHQKQSPCLFCSKKCSKDNKRIAVECKVCGKKFISYKSRLRKVCSLICRSKNNEGNNNIMRRIPPEKMPGWKGGISFNPYPSGWLRSFKNQIRQRDSFMCQICKKSTKENRRALDIHHKDYNKENIADNNLISLCSICHGKTNHDREFWKEYFNVRTFIQK